MSKHRRDRKSPAIPNYQPEALTAILWAMETGQLQPGGHYQVDVRHDGWCNLLAGKGPCNCNPEVSDPHRVHDPEDN